MWRNIIFLAALTLLLSACTKDQGRSSGFGGQKWGPAVNNIACSLQTRKTMYPQGEPLDVRFTIWNGNNGQSNSPEPKIYYTRDPGIAVGFIIRSSDGKDHKIGYLTTKDKEYSAGLERNWSTEQMRENFPLRAGQFWGCAYKLNPFGSPIVQWIAGPGPTDHIGPNFYLPAFYFNLTPGQYSLTANWQNGEMNLNSNTIQITVVPKGRLSL